MERFMWVLTLGVALTVTGCALFEPKETQYLKSAQDVATQQEVRENLGPPKRTTTTAAGETQWVYEVRQLEPGSQNTWAAVGSWCDEYFLTFDRGGVLRKWDHKSYLHGGEMMPASCNSTMGVQKPAL
jgi:hypothetical protein